MFKPDASRIIREREVWRMWIVRGLGGTEKNKAAGRTGWWGKGFEMSATPQFILLTQSSRIPVIHYRYKLVP